MKNIYLEEDDEIISVIDKIKNSPANELNLVFPKKSPLIRSIVNLKILKRQSDLLKKNIFVSTQDEVGKALAQKAKLKVNFQNNKSDSEDEQKNIDVSKEEPVFKSYKEKEIAKNIKQLKKIPTPEVNKADYKKISENSKRKQIEALKKKFSANQKPGSILLPSKTGKIILGFFAFCFLVGAVAIIFFLPQATVLYLPKTEPFTHNLEAELIKNLDQANISEKQLPFETTVIQKDSDEMTFPATGEKEIGAKAKGQIIIYNKYSSDPQPLIATTRFTGNNGKIYRLVNNIEIPGAKIEAGKTIPGRINAIIEADAIGPDYNLESGAFAIPGLPLEKQEDIYAESLEEIMGGESKKIIVITADDLKKAKESLQQKVNEKNFNEFKNKIPPDKIIIDSAIKNEILDTKTTGEENKETRDFKLSVSVKSTIPYVSKQDLQKIIFEEAKQFLPENKILLDENLDSGIKFEQIAHQEDTIILKISLDKQIYAKIDDQEIKNNLVGKTASEAQNYILTNPYIYKAEVMLWPFWVKKVPRLKNKIDIRQNALE